jgi:hypothetical protein
MERLVSAGNVRNPWRGPSATAWPLRERTQFAALVRRRIQPSTGNSEDITMKRASPTGQTEQDANAKANSDKPATTHSGKPGSGQHAANHTQSGKDHGAGGGAKQRHGTR